jgi:hypothetical protein
MSYLSFENNIIEASGSLILKSTSDVIDCSGATISNVIINGTIAGSDKIKVTSIEASLNDISFNNSNLLDVSSIQVNNDVSCSSLTVNTIGFVNHNISFSDSNLLDVSSIQIKRIDATDIYVDGSLTVINTIDLDISDNIIGLNRGHTGVNNTSGMLINFDISNNIFFGYHKDDNAFVIADTNYNHNDDSRKIVVDKYVNLKVGRIDFEFDTSGTEINTYISSSDIPNNILYKDISYCTISEYKWKSYFNKNDAETKDEKRSFSINVPHFDNDSSNNTNLKDAPIIFQTSNSFVFMIDNEQKYLHLNKDGNIFLSGDIDLSGDIFLSGNLIDFTNRNRRIYNNNDAMHIQTYDKVIFGKYESGGSPLTIDISNQTIKGDYNIDISGTVTAGSFNATSDYRTKTNIEELDENITVSNLRPLVYLKNGQKEIGLLAHELQEVYPFMVCGEKDGKEMQSVNYNCLIGVLINDVKRLTNENQILKFRLDSLEEKFDKQYKT